MIRSLIVLLALLVAGGAWWLATTQPVDQVPEGESVAAPGMDKSLAAELVQAMKSAPRAEAAKPSAPADETPKARYPDGSRWPSLNGCGDVEVQWPDGEDYSPIIRRHTDKRGQGWYEHEDGSWSTMQRMEIQGKLTDVPQVFIPKPLAAIEPGAADGK